MRMDIEKSCDGIQPFEPWIFLFFGAFHLHRIWGLLDRKSYAEFWINLMENKGLLYYFLMGVLAVLCIWGIKTFFQNLHNNFWWRWIYIFCGGYVLFDLFAIAAELEFWHELIFKMYDIYAPYWNVLWSCFIALGGVSFALGLKLLLKRRIKTQTQDIPAEPDEIIECNKTYWNDHADLWFGTTALPEYGVRFPTEDDLHLFGDTTDKKLLEICCGSGHSLKYHAQKGAGELWGVDLSQKQLDNASRLLDESGYTAKLICAKMEDELDVPKEYFDYVYSIYGIGWTTDLQGTFDKIASYLKKDGIFIFSWHHTLNYCVAWSCDERKDVFEDDKLVMMKSYYDESYFKMPVHDSEIVLCNRKISTYINALAKAGFVIERLVEETDEDSLCAKGEIDPKTRKAQMLPISFCIKARKL